MIVTLMAIGRVPQLKQNKVSMPGTRTMAELSSFIRKKLSLDPKNNLVWNAHTHTHSLPLVLVLCVL